MHDSDRKSAVMETASLFVQFLKSSSSVLVTNSVKKLTHIQIIAWYVWNAVATL